MDIQGIQPATYMTKPRTLIFLFWSDRVLLLKRALEKKIWPGYYNGVGGQVEPGEDILTGARRELEEETGLSRIPLQFCASVIIDTGKSVAAEVSVFKGAVGQVSLRDSGEGTLEWVAVNRMHQLQLVPDLHILLPRVVKWQVGDPVLFARYFYSEEKELQVTFSSDS